MIPISRLFDICYPSTLVFGHQKIKDDGIPFVTSRGNDNGVAGRVEPIPGATLFQKGSITVPLKGTVLAAYMQPEDFYCAHQIAVLSPKVEMTEQQIFFYVAAIRHNKFRFSYGRQADRTFRSLEVPDLYEIPQWVETLNSNFDLSSKLVEIGGFSDVPRAELQSRGTGLMCISDLFDVVYGTNLELNRLTEIGEGGVNFISRTSRNNGVSARVKALPNLQPIPGGVLTVAGGGSVLETFYQVEPFYSGRDLYYLRPLLPLTPEEMFFYAACLRANRYRYNYGRQANRTLRDIQVPTPDVIPSWVYGSCRRVTSSLGQ